MQLSVYVLGREVATLEPSGDFKSVLSYHPGVAKNYLHEPEIQSPYFQQLKSHKSSAS
jgi:hypothetical protein